LTLIECDSTHVQNSTEFWFVVLTVVQCNFTNFLIFVFRFSDLLPPDLHPKDKTTTEDDTMDSDDSSSSDSDSDEDTDNLAPPELAPASKSSGMAAAAEKNSAYFNSLFNNISTNSNKKVEQHTVVSNSEIEVKSEDALASIEYSSNNSSDDDDDDDEDEPLKKTLEAVKEAKMAEKIAKKKKILPGRKQTTSAVSTKKKAVREVSLSYKCTYVCIVNIAIVTIVLFICKTKSRLRRRHCGLARHFKTDPTESVAVLDTRRHFSDDEGIVAWRVISKQILLRP
jgi:hypothetical protein